MKYLNQKCTHCDKLFTKDDDVVVCPVCGTPQHRECYEEHNQCINQDKHAEGYVWSADNTSDTNSSHSHTTNDFTICSNCGTKNSGDSFFCKHCSAPLGVQKQGGYNHQNPQGNPDFQGMPFGASPFKINENEEIAPGVKMGEAQKYVKNNSLFFSLIFKRIHDHNRSRFNFAAFIFSGGWFLFRKQYLLGTILTVLFGLFTITYNVLYTPVYNMMEYYNIITESGVFYDQFAVLSTQEMAMCFLWSFSYMARFILMIVSGFIANRCYYDHVVKKVRLAKQNFHTEAELKAHLSEVGGVNTVLGYILLAVYAIVSFIPMLL